MATTLTLGAITVLDLTDRTKWRVIERSGQRQDIEREYRSGCGASGTRLVKRRVKSETIPLEVYFTGATADAAFANRDSFFTRLAEAVAYQSSALDDANYVAAPTYYIRGIGGQDPKDFWTVFDFDSSRLTPWLDVQTVPQIGYAVDLIAYPGQLLPGGV